MPSDWYGRPTETVARDLIGQLLLRRSADGLRMGRIVETEAYVEGDRANHATCGPTLRNRAMFGPPGTLYVYRIHQVHCANVVTGFGEAVLLRSVEPLWGIDGDPRGPGRLCRALDLVRADNSTSLVRGLARISEGSDPRPVIESGVRVGIRHDIHRRLRFAERGSPWVSKPRLRARPRARPVARGRAT